MRTQTILFALCCSILSWGSASALGSAGTHSVSRVPGASRPTVGPPVWTGVCGDGQLDPGEECDPGLPELGVNPDLGGNTCESEGYNGGDLRCNATCELERSGCSCGSGGSLAALPKTGQTACWDVIGTPIDCAGTGQDGEYQRGVSVSPRFTDLENGAVKDNLTGLIWLKSPTCFIPFTQDWVRALTDAKNLASGSCGLSDGSVEGDWRLPNVTELQSLFNLGNSSPALPPGHPFPTGLSSYWTSTTVAAHTDSAWAVGAGLGIPFFVTKTTTLNVWPVRGGP